MSQPPVDPAGLPSSTDASPTEPVPAFESAPPQAPAVSPPPAALSTGAAGTDLAFTPVEPEAGPGQASSVPPAPASPGARSGSGSSRPMMIAIGAIVLVGVAAVALAAGLTIAPASDTTRGVSNRPEQQGGGQPGGRPGQGGGGQGQGRDHNGQGRGGQGQGRDGNGQGQFPGGQGQFPGGGRMNGNGQGPMGGGLFPDASLDPNGNGWMPGHAGGDAKGAIPGMGLGRAGMGDLDVTGTVTAVTPESVTLKTEAGMTVTIGLDAGTTYHQQAPATSSDVTTGKKIQVQLDAGVRPSRDASGNIHLGTAGDITVVP
jgi:hypothetical protein